MNVQEQAKQRLKLTLSARFLSKPFLDYVIYKTQFFSGGMETVPLSVSIRTPIQTTWVLGGMSFLSLMVSPRSFIKSNNDVNDTRTTLGTPNPT